MKEIDDTDPPESESEWTLDQTRQYLKAMFDHINHQIRELTLRIANLETQRTPEMENDDPEWFS